MPNSYTANIKLTQPAVNDTGWGPTLNGDLATLDALASIGPLAVTTKEVPSTTLNVAVAGGSMVTASGAVVAYAGSASVAIPAVSTRYLYLDNTGVLQVATAWPTATAHVPLAVVVAGATTITGVTDARIVFRTCTR